METKDIFSITFGSEFLRNSQSFSDFLSELMENPEDRNFVSERISELSDIVELRLINYTEK